jgi:hypothetical protein
MDNDDVIETLNDLLEISRDGEQGFRTCAEGVRSPNLKALFEAPTTPQLSSLLPLVVRPRRWCPPNDAPGASRELGRREKYDPIANREHSIATLYPSKSTLIVIPTARQLKRATLKSP